MRINCNEGKKQSVSPGNPMATNCIHIPWGFELGIVESIIFKIREEKFYSMIQRSR